MSDAVPGTRTQQVLSALRTGALFRATVAMEANLAWPAPLIRGGQPYLLVPVYRSEPRETSGLSLMAPHARFTLQWPTGAVVGYVDHRVENPWPWDDLDYTRAVGAFPHPGLPDDRDTYLHRRGIAFAGYDELFGMLAARTQPAGDWWSRFAGRLGPLLEPGLLPFYRLLAPKFFARLVPEGTAR